MATHTPFLNTFSSEEPEQEWTRPVSDVHLAPIKPRWTTDPPTHPGIWWVRSPGFEPKVVQVYSDGGRLSYSWTDIDPTPVLRDGALEWSDRAIVLPS